MTHAPATDKATTTDTTMNKHAELALTFALIILAAVMLAIMNALDAPPAPRMPTPPECGPRERPPVPDIDPLPATMKSALFPR